MSKTLAVGDSLWLPCEITKIDEHSGKYHLTTKGHKGGVVVSTLDSGELDCSAHGGHGGNEPVIIIVDGIPVEICPPDQG